MSETRRRFKSAHSCRVCGHWSEGDWNRADGGPAGDPARAKAEREMDRGCCDTCWERLAAPEPGSIPLCPRCGVPVRLWVDLNREAQADCPACEWSTPGPQL